MERVLDEISFTAADRNGDKVRIDATYVKLVGAGGVHGPIYRGNWSRYADRKGD
jgi:hypothetical protein